MIAYFFVGDRPVSGDCCMMKTNYKLYRVTIS